MISTWWGIWINITRIPSQLMVKSVKKPFTTNWPAR
jgi:hypothetical protein